jgi:hypothetical protein
MSAIITLDDLSACIAAAASAQRHDLLRAVMNNDRRAVEHILQTRVGYTNSGALSHEEENVPEHDIQYAFYMTLYLENRRDLFEILRACRTETFNWTPEQGLICAVRGANVAGVVLMLQYGALNIDSALEECCFQIGGVSSSFPDNKKTKLIEIVKVLRVAKDTFQTAGVLPPFS